MVMTEMTYKGHGAGSIRTSPRRAGRQKLKGRSSRMTRILVIDDEAASRATLTRLLTRSSYEVLEAADANEGLQCLADGSPEVLLVNLFMPERDGLETIPRILLRCARRKGEAR
jgi:PleD family two-component response regulator